jgi:hypothetical protein
MHDLKITITNTICDGAVTNTKQIKIKEKGVTTKNFQKAIRQIAKVKPGEKVLFHYSGPGCSYEPQDVN